MACCPETSRRAAGMVRTGPPVLLPLLSRLVLLVASTGVVVGAPSGCAGGAPRQTLEQRQQQTAQQEARQRMDELLHRVQQEEAGWRALIAEQRRQREGLMALPGSSGLGLAQKQLQHLAQDAGLQAVGIRPQGTSTAAGLVAAHPLLLTAEGNLTQIVQFLGRVEAAGPRLGVRRFSLARVRTGTGGEPDRMRLEAVAAAHTREVLPPPPTPLPPMGEIPLQPEDALRMLTARLLTVQGAAEQARKQLERLGSGMELIEAERVPIRSVFGPLGRLLREVKLAAAEGGAGRFRLEGTTPDHQAAERFRRAVEESHPFLAPLELALERKAVHPGWETQLVLTCAIEAAKQQQQPAPAEASPGLAVPLPAPIVTLPLDEPPPPAPVVTPAMAGAATPQEQEEPAATTAPAP